VHACVCMLLYLCVLYVHVCVCIRDCGRTFEALVVSKAKHDLFRTGARRDKEMPKALESSESRHFVSSVATVCCGAV
jgi:hypothetical protein